MRVSIWRDYQHDCARVFWESLLKHTGGNVTQAAKIAGVNRTDCYKVLAKLGLRPEPHRGAWDRPVPGIVEWTSPKAPAVPTFKDHPPPRHA